MKQNVTEQAFDAQLREKLQDAVGALLLQAKIQGFSKWQSDYISGNDLRL